MSENKVLATVYGEQLTEADLNDYIKKLPENQQRYAANPQFREQVLEQVINMKLLLKFAKDTELEKTEKFQELLEGVKMDILTQLAVETIMSEASVDETVIKEYYDAHTEEFKTQESVSAKHILVDDEAKCKEIMEEVNSGVKSFEDAAKEYSNCPSSQRGGDLGTFGHGQMVPEFDQAAFAADVDSVVGPVKTNFGYHLIKVYNKEIGKIKSYEEVKDELSEKLLQEFRKNTYVDKMVELRKVGLER